MTNLRIVTSHKHSKEPLDDTSDIELLHAISVDLIAEQDSLALYGKIVDAAISITRSQFGTMQVLRRNEDGAGSGLHLLTSRGLSPESAAFWKWVPSTALSSCTQALKLGRRAIIEDFETWPEIVGTSDLLAFRRAGIRSAQTTPLVSRDGTLLGMISTHWSDSHQPSERDLRLLDILARQAADLLERTMAEEALRERERALETSVAKLREMQVLQKLLSDELGHRAKNLFAMVTAITSHTLRDLSDQAQVQTLQQRLTALSSANDILLQSNWKAALLGDVALAAVRSAGVAGRIHIEGPDVEIGSKAALNVALLLHELTTNALKHGSLSVGGGSVDLTWRLEGKYEHEVLRLTWRETRGPAVVKPERRGFGSRLISAGLGGSGDVIVAYNHTGLMCETSARLIELRSAE